jgi:signal transduction histidine kinase/HPt (histidine-containing phosphotransfer) domain-containing protein
MARGPEPRAVSSLATRSVVGLAVVCSALLLGVLLGLETYGRRLVVEETTHRLEERGNRSVESLTARMEEIAALARTVARVTESLPTEVAEIERVLPRLIDFQGDPGVAGGGYWPEPGAFTAGVERRSFFWGRDAAGQLRPYLDYNEASGPGYHGEEWYLPARFLPPEQVYWSRPYTDPYTFEPMVTCAAASYRDGRFVGVTTIDLKLDSLSSLADRWGRELGGYAFLVDRNNRFITFPQRSWVVARRESDNGQPFEERLAARDLAAREPRFTPIADALEATAAALAEPARHPRSNGHLAERVEVADDLIVGERALALVFTIPESHWKFVAVYPKASAGLVAARISEMLMLGLAPVIVTILLAAYSYVARRFIGPLSRLAATARRVQGGELGAKFDSGGEADEIAALGASFNDMMRQLQANRQRLEATNQRLQESLLLTEAILTTVHEGLFLLDRGGTIQPGYSRALEQVLGERQLAGRSFLELVTARFPAPLADLVGRYLSLLFDGVRSDALLVKINPLREVEAQIAEERGVVGKSLAFTFDRVREGSEIRLVLVTVADVTARVELAERLSESQRRNQDQRELLLSILHVEASMLSDFIDGVTDELAEIDRLLRGGETGAATSQEGRWLLERILRGVHNIKGAASMLGIEYFATTAHQFESVVLGLKEKLTLVPADLAGLRAEIGSMLDNLRETRAIIERFGRAASPPSARSGSESALLSPALTRFVGELAERAGKKAELVLEIPEALEIPFRLRDPVRRILAQLLRNAVVHGIEAPDARRAAGKPEAGQLWVTLGRGDGQLELLVRDDGVGFAAGSAGLIEHAGFAAVGSRLAQADLDGGRGVGLAAVEELVQGLSGTLGLRYEAGAFCELRVVLPCDDPRRVVAA